MERTDPNPPPAPMPARPKVIVIMPAYNAARTLERTYDDIPKEHVDEILLVDDASRDETVETARRLGIEVIVHTRNRGYGGNQKTCYSEALRRGADIVVMIHPDYQYDPKVLPDLIRPIREGRADVVFGSRMLTPGGARAGGMPLYKYLGNRFLTTIQNLVFGRRFSEYHTGLRAYGRPFLESIDFLSNSDSFGFDSQVVGQLMKGGFRLVEISVETRYFDEASSVNVRMSLIYGLATLGSLWDYLVHRWRERARGRLERGRSAG